MAEYTLMFAPHLNSYRRLLPGGHAPTSVAWGYENRTVAVCVPGVDPRARRIEHRVAGADANRYLVLAAVLGRALLGLERCWAPPPPVSGDAYALGTQLLALPHVWDAAMHAFEAGEHVQQVFAPPLQRILLDCKRHRKRSPAT